MDWWRPEFVFPIAGALLAGCAIGFEREVRARAAGFRTHALVCMSSALLMLAAVHQVDWAGPTMPEEVMRVDPVRMAHGVLTGIGFLCGGVIFREGLSVHGLTTAASLWTTSALGLLFGAGLYGLAFSGTVVTLIILSLFKLIDSHTWGQSLIDVRISYRRGEAPGEDDLRDDLKSLGVKLSRVAHRLTEGGEVVEYDALLTTTNRQKADAIARHFRDDPRVLEYAIEPRNT